MECPYCSCVAVAAITVWNRGLPVRSSLQLLECSAIGEPSFMFSMYKSLSKLPPMLLYKQMKRFSLETKLPNCLPSSGLTPKLSYSARKPFTCAMTSLLLLTLSLQIANKCFSKKSIHSATYFQTCCAALILAAAV